MPGHNQVVTCGFGYVTMPIDLSLYPKNWKQIAHSVKERAGWRCQDCSRLCRKPNETVSTLAMRLQAENPNSELSEVFAHPQRWCLTTAHLDHRPSNNALSNLRALALPVIAAMTISQCTGQPADD